jgi:hypothetical protein
VVWWAKAIFDRHSEEAFPVAEFRRTGVPIGPADWLDEDTDGPCSEVHLSVCLSCVGCFLEPL